MSKTKYRCKECGNDDQNLIVWEWTMNVPVNKVSTIEINPSGMSIYDGVRKFDGEFTGYERCDLCFSDDLEEVQDE
tara:strand:- start:1844 stop:2071 length:228 start_codon:yes stop_codon:yes gene_type:complete